MQWQVIVALVIAIPVILLPVVFIWFLNLGGIYTAIKEMRAKRVARDEEIGDMVEEKVLATATNTKRGQDE